MTLEDSKLYTALKARKSGSSFIPNIDKAFKYASDTLPLVLNVFTNYTQHDIGHSLRVSNYMFDLITDIKAISDLEIALMLFSAIFHDIGMCVTDEQIDSIKQDKLQDIKYKYDAAYKDLKNEKLALQECIRPIHSILSARHLDTLMEKEKTCFSVPNWTTSSILDDVKKICQSHNEDVDWIKEKLDFDSWKGDYPHNSQYIALLLRLADLLDFDGQRTPEYLYGLINPQGKSDEEWKQHFVIENAPKIFKDKDTKLKFIKFSGKSSDPQIHRKFLKYVDYINNELINCHNIAKDFKDPKYFLNVKTSVENKVKTNSFTFSDFKLNLDYNAVTNLLMGENIYGDKKYGLRELLQNSIDACLHMSEIASTLKEEYKYEPYNPTIKIILDEENNEVIVRDNGTGMSFDILKNFFLKIGVSYYLSNEYKYKGYSYKPIGNYGIGFLACFMLSNKVKINTKRYDDIKINAIDIEKNSEYICLTQESKSRRQGTDIILNLSEFKKIFSTSKDIKDFIEKNFIECNIPITIQTVENGVNQSQNCDLIEIQEDSKIIIRLDDYLNKITGYIEIENITIDFIKNLKMVSNCNSYIYDLETNKLIDSDTLEINLDKFINNGKIFFLTVPLIDESDSDDFKKYVEVLDDVDEAIRKFGKSKNIDIFCIDNTTYSDGICGKNDTIIGDYTFEKLCEEHNHSSNCQTYIELDAINVIQNNSKSILPYKLNEHFEYFIFDRSDKIFVKNVLISKTYLYIPFLVDGITLKSALFNIQHEKIIPNVARNSLSERDTKDISYAIGKALHLWIRDTKKLDSDGKSLIEKFIEECYPETNEFLK